MTLESLPCPDCKTLIEPRNGEVKTSSSFEDCLRRCEKCGVGFSNAQNNPTLIYKRYSDNVPEPLRRNLDKVLNSSFNQYNQQNKKNKFGFSTSEDALTWSFFNYFVMKNRFKDLLRLLCIESDETSFEVYLWGARITQQINEADFTRQFIDASNFFKEDTRSMTEPDVVIRLRNKLIFIEVKYRSPNQVIKSDEKFMKYLIPNIDKDKLFASKHYELYRNWAFASKLSDGDDFELINLGLQKLFTDENKAKLKEFEDSLDYSKGRFVKLSWEQIIDSMKEKDYEIWFMDYLKQKIHLIPLKHS